MERKIHLASRPSDPARRASIENGTVNAIFDEGIKSWARTALENGFRFLPVEGTVLKSMVAMGCRSDRHAQVPLPGMAEDITNHRLQRLAHDRARADMRDDAAYAICEAHREAQRSHPHRQL